MVQTVFDNHGVAHVWAQGEQAEGRSNNSNFYFEGPGLFSYGRHYPVGFLLTGLGVAFLNSDSSSITTNGKHKPAARGATSHLVQYSLPDMGEALGGLEALAFALGDDRHRPETWNAARAANFKAQAKTQLARYCGKHALALAETLRPATSAERDQARKAAEAEADDSESWGDKYKREGEHLGRIQRENARPDALAYILGLIGLGRSHARMIKQAQADKAKEARREIAQAEARRENEARVFASATPDQMAEKIQAALGRYGARDSLERTGRMMLRAQKWAKGRKGWIRGHKAIQANRAAIRAAIVAIDARQGRKDAWAQSRAALEALRHLNTFQGGGVYRGLPGDGDARDHRAATEAQDHLERAALAARFNLARLADAPTMPTTLRRKVADALAQVTPAAEAAEATRLERAEIAQHARHQARMEEQKAVRLAWLAGDKAARFWGTDEKGGAYLRAVDVARDDSGQVTGGELQTSQGARVPLAHAIRVFRFLKHCRESGQTWARNGRTIRVGHYQVDAVESDGTFRAGCHLITWPQVESLAERLGVLDLAADSSVAAAREKALA